MKWLLSALIASFVGRRSWKTVLTYLMQQTLEYVQCMKIEQDSQRYRYTNYRMFVSMVPTNGTGRTYQPPPKAKNGKGNIQGRTLAR